MRHLLSLIAGLMLVLSLGTTSIAHAMEPQFEAPVTAPAVGTAGDLALIATGHTQGDADQVPADGDKGYPHHHGGCHGDHIAAPLTDRVATARPCSTSTPTLAGSHVLPSATADPALRPPQA